MGKEVIVIGSGATGLGAAYRLLKQGHGVVRVRVLESAGRVGGWVQSSFNQDAVLLELGPRSLRAAGSGVNTLKLIGELGLQDFILPAAQKSKVRYIIHKGERVALPSGPSSLFNNPFTLPLATGFALEPFQHRRDLQAQDESLHSFFTRRVGGFFSDTVLSAMVSGIWAGDTRKLSVKSTFPFLFDWEARHGSLAKAALLETMMAKPKPKDPQVEAIKARIGDAGVFSFVNGMDTLTNALESAVLDRGAEIHLNSRVTKLEFDQDTRKAKVSVDGPGGSESYSADHVIAAVDSQVTAGLLRSQNVEAAEHLALIKPTSLAIIGVNYREEEASNLGGFGHLVPNTPNREVLGVVYDSDTLPGQRRADCSEESAPKVCRLTVMTGGATMGGKKFVDDHSDQDFMELAIRNIRDQLGIRGDPLDVRVSRAYNAIPQYNLGHSDARDEARRVLREQTPWVSIAGSAYDGVGLNDCIMSGYKAADKYLGNAYLAGEI